MIGIVGGAGPFAGVDLARKICEETLVGRDQDHVPFALLSTPGTIADRTAFLIGEQVDNPGEAIADVVLALGDALEAWEMQRKLRKFQAKLGQPDGDAILDRDHVKGHFEDYGGPVMRLYDERVAQLEL